MQSSNTLWNLLRNWGTIVGAISSAVSVFITYLFMPATNRWTLPLIGALVLVVGIVVAALKVIKQNQTQADEQIGNRDRKIAELEEEIKRLKIMPFDVALESDASQKLEEFTDEGKKVLKYILLNGPLRAETRKVPDVEEADKFSALNTGYKNGLIERNEVVVGKRPETDWDIKEQFKPVLKQLLFPPHKELHSASQNRQLPQTL